MNNRELRDTIAGVLAGQRLAVLATHHDGQPYVSLMAFTETEDLRQLLFATTRATTKYDNLAADPRAAMMIDNRSNREIDFHEAVALTAVGRVEEVDEAAREAWREVYLVRHPYMDEFTASSSCALFRFHVEYYRYVERFQNVWELRVES